MNKAYRVVRFDGRAFGEAAYYETREELDREIDRAMEGARWKVRDHFLTFQISIYDAERARYRYIGSRSF